MCTITRVAAALKTVNDEETAGLSYKRFSLTYCSDDPAGTTSQEVE